ncbi:MAG: C_GCAxxG_C_C family protein [Clostridia bacterium]|nr:C_GCAxxG_C_C family protein [Clostridia bacterium]
MRARGEKAKQYFLEGYNCTQAVVLAFADRCDIDRDTLLKLASSFGGGMGRLREVCGTVSGMFIILGLISGYATPEKGAKKAAHYADVQELARRFEAENGSIVCRELLGLSVKRQDPTPDPRTPQYYQKRPCPDLVAQAAEILEAFLAEQ